MSTKAERRRKKRTSQALRRLRRTLRRYATKGLVYEKRIPLGRKKRLLRQRAVAELVFREDRYEGPRLIGPLSYR